MPILKNVIVLGASGNIGKPIVDALLADGSFSVTAFSRKESKATFPDGVKVIKSDFSPESLVEAFKGQDAIVSATSMMDGHGETSIVDAAIKAGVKRFITNDFGADVENPNVLSAAPFVYPKVEAVKYLKEKQDQGLSWTSIVCSAFTELGLSIGFLGFDLKERKATIYDSGDFKTATTTYANIGRAVVGILSKPKETANRYVRVASFAVSQNELLGVLEKVIGEKFKVEHSTTKQMREEGLEAFGKGDYSLSTIHKLLAEVLFNEANGSDYALNNDKNDSELLGLEKEDLETVVRSVYQSIQK